MNQHQIFSSTCPTPFFFGSIHPQNIHQSNSDSKKFPLLATPRNQKLLSCTAAKFNRKTDLPICFKNIPHIDLPIDFN
ncbi:MAG: hypothetical protein CL915_11940 [Deltaproteobacteria bacterium]|nr:hypothetical protein [Deltaproteobacteria bacterium]